MKTVSITIFTQKKNKVATEAITAIRKKLPRKLYQSVYAPENENDRPGAVMNLIESTILPCSNNTAMFCDGFNTSPPQFGYYAVMYVKVFDYYKHLYLKHQ